MHTSAHFSADAMPAPAAGVSSGAIDPEAERMADALLEHRGAHGGVTEGDLIEAGFTPTAIALHGATAIELARVKGVRRGDAPPDGRHQLDLHTTIDRCAVAVPHLPPMMAGAVWTQQQDEDWSVYVRARAAHRVDPHGGQRDRCLLWLSRVLRGLPLLPAERERVRDCVVARMRSEVATDLRAAGLDAQART